MDLTGADFTIVDAGEAELEGITEIYNHAVLQTLSIWSEITVTASQRREWMQLRRDSGFPVLAAVSTTAPPEVLGYASYGRFRDFPGFSGTVEHSVYVAPAARRRGVARALLNALILRAKSAGADVMVGCIEAGNEPSLSLHAACGFREEGRLTGVGRKFGRRLDLVLMTLELGAFNPPQA